VTGGPATGGLVTDGGPTGRAAVRREAGPGGRVPTSGRHPRRVHFGETVVLTKLEVFAACQALADADRALRGSGRDVERSGLAELFALLERRLVRT
jgi:hypothetical protein